MLRIQVSGFAGEGKSEIISIVREALQAKGKRVLVVEDRNIVANPSPSRIDVVMEELCLARHNVTHRQSTADLDFLIGRSESEAYTLAQDNGFRVRIATRNRISMLTNPCIEQDCVDLHIVDNIVVSVNVT